MTLDCACLRNYVVLLLPPAHPAKVCSPAQAPSRHAAVFTVLLCQEHPSTACAVLKRPAFLPRQPCQHGDKLACPSGMITDGVSDRRVDVVHAQRLRPSSCNRQLRAAGKAPAQLQCCCCPLAKARLVSMSLTQSAEKGYVRLSHNALRNGFCTWGYRDRAGCNGAMLCQRPVPKHNLGRLMTSHICVAVTLFILPVMC